MTTPLEGKAIDAIQNVYAWRPMLLYKAGLAIGDYRSSTADKQHFGYKDQTLFKLASSAGILKPKAKRAPALLYFCLKMAENIPRRDLIYYQWHRLGVDHIRLILRALARDEGYDPKRILSDIRDRLDEYGNTRFATYMKKLIKPKTRRSTRRA